MEPGIEPSGLSSARIYDYYLGGQVNSAIDREAARLLMAAAPGIRDEARANRAFVVRAVRELAGLGIEQFLDIGAGVPFSPNVHEVARGARVVYVDNDATVLREYTSAAGDDPRIAVVEGDLTDPRAIFDHPRVAGHLDLTRPAVILLAGVIHCIKDDDEADRAATQVRALVPAGGFLVLSHGTTEGSDSAEVRNRVGAYSQITGGIYPRSRDRISGYFENMDLLEPGIVPVDAWRPDSPTVSLADPCGWRIVGGVGRARS
jgi:S-adenosyl methyltransferase